MSTTTTTSHYIFGYGSLICKHSRSLTTTAPSTIGTTTTRSTNDLATPVLVRGLERVWSVRAPTFCAMGVRMQPHAECLGVLLPVESREDLERLDERELGYQRMAIDRKNVVRVPFLDEKTEQQNNIFVGNHSDEREDSDICIWCYVPEEEWSSPPTAESPLVQSYIDTILRGCLDYNEEFAVSFIRKTAGWNTPHYVDDRHKPIYPRGDPDWSKKHATRLDALLREHLDEGLHCRRPL